MIRAIALLSLVAPAALAQTPPGGSGEYPCSQNEAQFARLIGGDPRPVEAALRVMPGIVVVRVGGPNTPMTMDHRVDRATVLVVDGVVRRITCG